MRFPKLPTVTFGPKLGILPYPVLKFASKRTLKDAILKGELDVEFVVGYTMWGKALTKKLTQMPVGTVVQFQGPSRLEPKYFGRFVRTLPIDLVKGIEIE